MTAVFHSTTRASAGAGGLAFFLVDNPHCYYRNTDCYDYADYKPGFPVHNYLRKSAQPAVFVLVGAHQHKHHKAKHQHRRNKSGDIHVTCKQKTELINHK